MNWIEVVGDKGLPASLNSDTLFAIQCAEDGAAIAISIGGAMVKLNQGYKEFMDDMIADQGMPPEADLAGTGDGNKGAAG